MPNRRTLFFLIASAAFAAGGLAIAADTSGTAAPSPAPLGLVMAAGSGPLASVVVTLTDARVPGRPVRAGFAAARLDGGRGYEIDTAVDRLDQRMNRETRTSVTIPLDQAAFERVRLVLDAPRNGGRRYGSWADVRRLMEQTVRAAGREPPRRSADPEALLAALGGR